MKNSKKEITDLEECKRKINNILDEYNCRIESDGYLLAWLRDLDTDQKIGIER